jgi:hypothetical protein
MYISYTLARGGRDKSVSVKRKNVLIEERLSI